MNSFHRLNWQAQSARLKSLVSGLALGLLGFAGLAHAHGDDYLDTVKAPNGGQLRMAGPYHLELVLKKDANNTQESSVAVFVTDHAGKNIATQGAKATITLLSGKQKSSTELRPTAPNQLTGQANYTANAALKAIVSVQFPGQDPQQARFTPFKPAPASQQTGHEGHNH